MTEELLPNDAIVKRIVDDIRNLPMNLVNNILSILFELSRDDQGSVQLALRWYLKSNGIYRTDLGLIGISDQFIRDEIFPCDVVLMGIPEKLKPDDLIVGVGIHNREILATFNRVTDIFEESVEVERLDGSRLKVAKNEILAKVLKVVCFGTPEWHEIVGETSDKEMLYRVLQNATGYAANDAGRRREIERRLKYINDKL